jgi:predicted phage tail protein
MVNIYLTGKLGRLFGEKWTLDVKSPAEAMQAIDVNLRGKLRQYLAGEGALKYYKVAVQKKNNTLLREEIKNPSGKGDIYIMPTIKGRGDNAGAKILIGAIFIIAAFASGGATLAASGFLGGFAPIVAGIGVSLVLGGITQLLTPTPSFNAGSATDQKQSSLFQGNATAISQGGAVPIVYGRVLVSPMPISVSNNSYDQPSTEASIGSVDQTELPGGGYEYTPA